MAFQDDDITQMPSPDTAFGAGGVKGRDAARRALKDEMASIKAMKGMKRGLNRAIRRKSPGAISRWTEAISNMGGNAKDIQSNAIPNSADIETQARANYGEKAERRFNMGKEFMNRDGADANEVEGQAGRAGTTNPRDRDADLPANSSISGGGVSGNDGENPTQEPQTTGNAKPQTNNPLIPSAGDQVESEFDRHEKQKQEFRDKYVDNKQKFADDLENSSLINQTDPNSFSEEDVAKGNEARENAYKRAERLGVTREQLQNKMRWETDTDAKKRIGEEKKQAIEEGNKKSRKANEALGITTSEDVYKRAESFGMSRQEFDRGMAEKFNANKDKRAETAKKFDEIRELIAKEQIRMDDTSNALAKYGNAAMDDSLIPTETNTVYKQTGVAAVNLVDSNPANGNAKDFFDFLKKSNTSELNVRDAMIPGFGENFSDSAKGVLAIKEKEPIKNKPKKSNDYHDLLKDSSLNYEQQKEVIEKAKDYAAIHAGVMKNLSKTGDFLTSDSFGGTDKDSMFDYNKSYDDEVRRQIRLPTITANLRAVDDFIFGGIREYTHGAQPTKFRPPTITAKLRAVDDFIFGGIREYTHGAQPTKF